MAHNLVGYIWFNVNYDHYTGFRNSLKNEKIFEKMVVYICNRCF